MGLIGTIIQLVIVLGIAVAVYIGVNMGSKVLDQGLSSVGDTLGKKGINITKSGVAVKTDKRAMTREETEDKLQSTIMRGWKATSFNVPYLLQKGSNLGGSKHDKGKAEYEAKYGVKKTNTVVQ